MSGWRQFADNIRRSDDAAGEGSRSPEDRTIVPFVPIVPQPPSLNPTAVLRKWHEQLSPVDPCRAPPGWSGENWRTLIEDAHWLYESFASHAVRDGWTAADLFGLWPSKPHWGGVADRLQGSRSLVMMRDRARWSRWGQAERFCRGAYPGLRPLWEA
jgi:hypothetical protein